MRFKWKLLEGRCIENRVSEIEGWCQLNTDWKLHERNRMVTWPDDVTWPLEQIPFFRERLLVTNTMADTVSRWYNLDSRTLRSLFNTSRQITSAFKRSCGTSNAKRQDAANRNPRMPKRWGKFNLTRYLTPNHSLRQEICTFFYCALQHKMCSPKWDYIYSKSWIVQLHVKILTLVLQFCGTATFTLCCVMYTVLKN